MKNKVNILLSVIAFLFVFAACNDDVPPPVITDFEIGYENNKIGVRGEDLHIEANILAEGRIDRIIVEIHYEGDHDKKNIAVVTHGWELEKTWTEYEGIKNLKFHKHIDIPADADLGEYHLHFKVVDKEGQTTDVEDEFEVVNP